MRFFCCVCESEGESIFFANRSGNVLVPNGTVALADICRNTVEAYFEGILLHREGRIVEPRIILGDHRVVPVPLHFCPQSLVPTPPPEKGRSSIMLLTHCLGGGDTILWAHDCADIWAFLNIWISAWNSGLGGCSPSKRTLTFQANSSDHARQRKSIQHRKTNQLRGFWPFSSYFPLKLCNFQGFLSWAVIRTSSLVG